MSDQASEHLARAAMGGDLPGVERALAAGGDPNAKVFVYSEWNTPLGLAVLSMDRDVVLRMVAAGGDLGVQQPRGVPVRTVCTHAGSDDFAAWLANLPEHRALVPRKPPTSVAGTPLHVGKLVQDVAGSWRPKLLAVLLDDHYRAAVEPWDLGMGLVQAARADCIESVRLLLSAGAPVDVHDPHSGYTALHWAASRSNVSIAKLLVDAKAGLDARQRAAFAPMHLAAEAGALDVMSLLLERGAHPMPHNGYGQTPFDMAIERDCPRSARFLIERGHGKAIKPGEALDKAFVHAVRQGNARILPLLASWGADVHQRPNGRTLMQLAPAQNQDVKRMIRAVQTGQLIEEAMTGDEAGPSESAPAASGGMSPL